MLYVFGVFFWFVFGFVWYCLGTVQLLFCLMVGLVRCGGLGLAAGGFFLVLGRCFWYALVLLLV